MRRVLQSILSMLPPLGGYREKRFKTYHDALERISGFIAFYNDTCPHSSIGMKTPSEAHQEQGAQRIMWKACGRALGGCLPPAAGHPLSVFHRSGCAA